MGFHIWLIVHPITHCILVFRLLSIKYYLIQETVDFSRLAGLWITHVIMGQVKPKRHNSIYVDLWWVASASGLGLWCATGRGPGTNFPHHIYTLPIGDIVRKYKMSLHLYAYDTQLYMTCDNNDLISKADAQSQMELCIGEICFWMQLIKLKLNNDKTEFPHFAPDLKQPIWPNWSHQNRTWCYIDWYWSNEPGYDLWCHSQ